MLLTITLTGTNTQDLGYLLYKNPYRAQACVTATTDLNGTGMSSGGGPSISRPPARIGWIRSLQIEYIIIGAVAGRLKSDNLKALKELCS